MAAAIMELWPNAKLTLGPAIENGFYYDVDFGAVKISEAEFPKIEAKMHQIAPTWKGFSSKELLEDEARKVFSDNPYKLEIIEEIITKKESVTVYSSGNFSDLCRGGHIDLIAQSLDHFKLLSVAGAYWRGSEKNKMLTRIYGTCWPTKQELVDYVTRLEEAKKHDHRVIGRQLDLFTFSDLIGKGLPLYLPKGALIRRLLNEFIEEKQKAADYTQVWTPQIAKAELFKISGHYDKYKEDMFTVYSHYSDEEMFLEPMNCPQHTQMFCARPRSYRELPIRLSDFAMLYRDEKPGELNGLARVRAFSTDDCHIFCTEEQVDQEVDTALQMTKEIMSTLGFKYRYRLSTRDPKQPEKYLGDPATWDKVEKWAVKIMQRNNIPYYDGPGEAAFYAPKMDLMATDALGREWQLSTVQIDYVMPERFGLEYIATDGTAKRPVMIHRAILGSAERAMMILIEHFAGSFPTWLNPVQVKILPIAERHLDYAKSIYQKLKETNIRVELDDRNEKLQAKIRDAQNAKVSYMLILGDKEVESNTVTERARSGKAYGPFSIEVFIENIKKEIADRINT
jgi:threonyl-tRNA synthetase